MISPRDSSTVKVAKGAALILAGIAFARLVNYAYRIVLAQAGGTAEFGLLTLGISTVAVAGGIAGLGFDLGVARFVPLHLGRGETERVRGVLRYALAASMLAGTAAGLGLWLAAPWIATGLSDNPRLVVIMKICALCLPFTVSSRVLVKALVAFQRIGYRVTANQVVNPLVRLLLTFALVAAGMGAAGAMWAYLGGELLGWALLLWLLDRRVMPLAWVDNNRTPIDIRAFITYSLPLFLSGIIDLVLNYTDTFMTEYFLGSSALGIYGSALALASLVALGSELLNPMFLSIISQDYVTGDTAAVSSTFNTNNRWFLLLTLPLVGVLTCLPEETMAFLWGESFAAGAQALVILVIGRAVYYLAATSAALLYMHGATRAVLISSIFAALLNAGLNYLLIPRMGINGAALATMVSLICYTLIIILSACLLHRDRTLRIFYPGIFAAAGVPAVVLLILRSSLAPGLTGLLEGGSAYLALYLVFLKLFRVFSAEDYSLWRKLTARLKGAGE